MHHQDDEVVAEAARLGVIARDELPVALDQLLRAEDLGGVEAAVDPDDPLAVARERPRLLGGDPLRASELLGDAPVALPVPEILRARDDRHQLRAPLGGDADGVEVHPV